MSGRPLRYRDFVIQIGSCRAEGCYVRVRSPAGEWAGMIDLQLPAATPVPGAGPWRDLWLSPGGGSWGARSDGREIGESLYRALFCEPVRSLFDRSLGSGPGAPLRLKLEIGAAATSAPLLDLPWELLYPPDRGQFLGLSRLTPVVRYLETGRPFDSLPLPSPLRILALISRPAGLPDLDLERERRGMEKLWEEGGPAEIVWLEGADLAGLRAALLRREFHVLHFMGHGGGDPAGGGVLFFTGRRGAAEAVTGPVLAAMLADFKTLRLIFLNACHTAAVGGRGTATGVAAALVAAGVPAVLAMRGPIPDELAVELSATFYRRLAAGDPVDAAATEGRLAVFAARPGSLEWASPALFMRSPDGQLFDVGENEAEDEAQLARYLRGVVDRCSELELPGPAAAGHGAVPLDDLYLAADCERLDATPPSLLPGAAAGERLPELVEALRGGGLLVVVGEPGGGKSTLLRWLALQMARARLRGDERVRAAASQVDPRGGDEGGVVDLGPALVPLLVTAAALAVARRREPDRWLDALAGQYLEAVCGTGYTAALAAGELVPAMPGGPGPRRPLLARLLAQGRAALLVDGLDELTVAAERRAVAREIATIGRTVVHSAPGGHAPPVIAATRPADDLAVLFGPEVGRVRLRPMGPPALARFCELWLRAVPAAGEGGAGAAATAADLRVALVDFACPSSTDGAAVAVSPMVATILALVFWRHRALPLRPRARLLQTAIDLHLEHWEPRGGGGRGGHPAAAAVRQRLLADLACLAAELQATPGVRTVSRERLWELQRRQHERPAASEPCVAPWEESGLVARRGDGLYGFVVPVFQEYLAACWLAAHGAGAALPILERLGIGGWRTPILLALGRLSLDLEEVGLSELLEELLARDGDFAAGLPRGALLIAGALSEMAAVPGGLVERVAGALLAAYVSGARGAGGAAIRGAIARAFSCLLRGEHAARVEGFLRSRLASPVAAPGEEARAVAAVLRAVRIYPAALLADLAAAAVRPGLQSRADGWEEAIDGLLRQVAAAEPALTLGERRSLRRWLQRHPEHHRRLVADGAWRRLVLAVYGGLAEGRFAVERMHRDSVLSPLLVEALTAGRSAASLAPELRLICRRAGDDTARLEAMLGLLALGEDVQAELAAGPALAPRLASRLALLCEALAGGVAAAVPALLAGLARAEGMAVGCPAQHRVDLAAAITAHAGASGRPAVELLELAASAAAEAAGAGGERAELLALIWRRLLAETAGESAAASSVRDGGDGPYRAAVLLDAAGGLLARSPLALAQALAAAHRQAGRPGSAYLADRLAPRAASGAVLVAAALDALDALAEPLDFVRGWVLEQLAPLVAEAGLLSEGLADALGSLSERFDCRAAAVQALLPAGDPRLRLIGEPDPFPDLVGEVAAIADGWTRFRGYRRLLLCFPGRNAGAPEGGMPAGAAGDDESGDRGGRLRPGRELGALGRLRDLVVPLALRQGRRHAHLERGPCPDLAEAAAEAARTIADPELQGWAWTELTWLSTGRSTSGSGAAAVPPSPHRRDWHRAARWCASRLREPEARARAFGRLAAVEGSAGAERCLARAVRAAAAIADRRHRSETLAALKDPCARWPRVRAQWLRAAGSLDALDRARLEGRNAPALLRYANALEGGGADAAPITLHALAEDRLRQMAPPGLRPQPSPGWDRAGVTPPDPRVPRAAPREVGAGTLSDLLDDLGAHDDRRRYAAALALHGDRSAAQPRLSAAHLGATALSILARRWLDTREDLPQLAQVIGWTFERVQHDDGAALAGWAEGFAGGPPAGSVGICGSDALAGAAGVILGHLEMVAANVWPVICRLLASGETVVRQALLRSLCRLLARRRVPEWAWEEIAPVLSSLRDVAEPESFLLDGPMALVEAAETALGVTATRRVESTTGPPAAGALVSAAESDLVRRCGRLADVVCAEPEVARERLRQVGDIRLVSARAEARCRGAVARLENAPEAFELLVEWLDVRLARDVQDGETWRPINSDLLTLVAAAAERWPEPYRRRGSKLPSLPRGLREAAELHDSFTGRISALILLAGLGRVTAGVIAALRAAAGDVAEVQTAALLALDGYREVEPECLPELFAALDDPSVVVAHVASRLLASLAIHGRLPLEIRDRAASAVAAAFALPGAEREVWLLARRDRPPRGWRSLGPSVRVECPGRLADSLAAALLALGGCDGRGGEIGSAGAGQEEP
jgi:hypothetical protein